MATIEFILIKGKIMSIKNKQCHRKNASNEAHYDRYKKL